MNDALPNLPALRHLGDLAQRLPCIVIDSREQMPLPITRLPVIRAGLYSGDYSVAGLQDEFGIERKSVADLVSCCCGSSRERLEHELLRLRGMKFKRLLIIGARSEIERGEYRSKVTPAAVLGSLCAWEIRFDIPVVWADTPEAGACMVETWSWYYARQQVTEINNLFRGTAAMPTTALEGEIHTQRHAPATRNDASTSDE